MDAEGLQPRRKPIFEGVAYYAPDGRNLGATLRLRSHWMLEVGSCVAFGLLVLFALVHGLKVGLRTDELRGLVIGTAVLKAVFAAMMLGLAFVHVRRGPDRIELYADVFVVGPNGLTRRWDRTARFRTVDSSNTAGRSDIVVETDDGRLEALVEGGIVASEAPQDCESLADFLNAFKAADDEGRTELIRDFRPIRLKADRRP